MADIFALQAQIELDFAKLKAQLPAIKRMVSDALKIGDVAKGSPSTGGGNLLSGLGKLLAPIATMAGGIALLVSSSGALQGVLKGILRTVMLIVKPIGDLLAVGLMPIIAILRPIGMFFKILLAPYIDKARQAMMLGNKLTSKGDYAGAAAAFGLGATYLLKPFFDMLVTGFTILSETIAGIIKGLGNVIIDIFNVGGVLNGVKESWNNIMNSAIERIAVGGIAIINTTNDWMGQQLTALNIRWESVKTLADVKMNDYGKIIGSGFINIIGAVTDYMTGSSNSMDAAVIDGFTNGVIPATISGMSAVTAIISTQWSSLTAQMQNKISQGIYGGSKIYVPTTTAPQFGGAGMGGTQTAVNITVNPNTSLRSSDIEAIIKKVSDNLRSEMRASGK